MKAGITSVRHIVGLAEGFHGVADLELQSNGICMNEVKDTDGHETEVGGKSGKHILHGKTGGWPTNVLP